MICRNAFLCGFGGLRALMSRARFPKRFGVSKFLYLSQVRLAHPGQILNLRQFSLFLIFFALNSNSVQILFCRASLFRPASLCKYLQHHTIFFKMAQRRLSVTSFLHNLNSIEDYGSSSSSGNPSHSNSGSNARHTSNGADPSGSSSSASTPDDELAIFANTQFFDFDMGATTDIAATMDDLLMQQEHQLQKSKGFGSDLMFNNGSSSSQASSSSHVTSPQYQSHLSSDMSLDLAALQQFSLANELLPVTQNNVKPQTTAAPESVSNISLAPASQSLNGHHEFTDPLTLTTQPRLSHLVASPALNSMINHHQNLNGSQVPFPQPHQNLTASQQLQLFIQQQIQAHGKLPQQQQQQPQQQRSPVAITPAPSSSPLQQSVKSEGSTPETTRSIKASIPETNDANVPVPPPNSKRRRTSIKAAVATASVDTEVALSRKNSIASFKSDSVELMSDDLNDVSKVAEEDKRRRNTAASARFRVKKKLREQEMERTTKDLQDKVKSMETRIMQLEMENRWLKNLVVEKNEARNTTELHDMKKKILEEASISAKGN